MKKNEKWLRGYEKSWVYWLNGKSIKIYSSKLQIEKRNQITKRLVIYWISASSLVGGASTVVEPYAGHGGCFDLHEANAIIERTNMAIITMVFFMVLFF